jgi:hypothetical protein
MWRILADGARGLDFGWSYSGFGSSAYITDAAEWLFH